MDQQSSAAPASAAVVLPRLRETSTPSETDNEEAGPQPVAEPEAESEPGEFETLAGLDENWSELYD